MKIAIIGLGQMGGWFAQKLSDKYDICIYDIEPACCEKFQNCLILPELSALKNFAPDILINAVSLQNTIAAFKSATPFLPPDCILSDLASIKGNIPDYYRQCGFRFTSLHPMFGPTFANVERIEDENIILIKESEAAGLAFFRSFFAGLGLNIFAYSFSEHDQMCAYSLTLPFASTMVFAACMNNSAVPGTTFRKHLEIARGLLQEDDFLLSEILFNSFSLAQLEKVTGRLEFLKHVIKGKITEDAKNFFDQLRSNIE